MEVLTRIINTMKALIKDKSYIIVGIILPIFIIVFFSFEFVEPYKFKVGVIDKDNSYASKEIIRTIDSLEDIQSVKIKEEDCETLLISKQIQIAVVIKDDFQNNLLNSEHNEIKIKSIKESDIKTVVQTMIELKCEDLSMIAKMSNKDINKLKEINQDYNDKETQLSLNDVDKERPKIESSLGLIIFVLFISGCYIANFLIKDEESKIKIRIPRLSIRNGKYYASLIFTFYIMSSITTLIYYVLAKTFNIDFGMENSINFLVVMLLLNLVVISFNLFTVSFIRSRHASSVVNVLIILPCCMLSGVFWDFYIMPENLQVIGRFMPTRWAYVCIESLQKTNNLDSINMYLSSMVILSIIFFIISFVKLKINKEV